MKDYHKMPENPNDKFSSRLKYLRIFIPKGKNESGSEYPDFEHFVGRKKLMDRLFNWLSDENAKGSYLITGYRGMGKSSLVEHVMERLVGSISKFNELLCYISLAFMLFSAFAFYMAEVGFDFFCKIGVICIVISVAIYLFVYFNQKLSKQNIDNSKIESFPNKKVFNKTLLNKAFSKLDKSKQSYQNIKININLGHEVLNERDILCLITNNIRDEYKKFVKSVQFCPIPIACLVVTLGVLAALVSSGIRNVIRKIAWGAIVIQNYSTVICITEQSSNNVSDSSGSWFLELLSLIRLFLINVHTENPIICHFILFIACVCLIWVILKLIISKTPMLQTPITALRRLDFLCERISSSLDVELGANQSVGSTINVSLFNRRKRKSYPIADVREIESELTSIINDINSDACLRAYRAKFFIIFDELDKIDPDIKDDDNGNNERAKTPEYTDAVKGFTSGIDSCNRRQNVLKLLANIKLFVSSVRAKFIFISGRELYDAFLADLSDRDFAISSVFTGVINVDSFLSPEDGQTDVRLMAEWYVVNRLLPTKYLHEKEKNSAKKKVAKKEMPSLKWYYEYLVEYSTKGIENEPAKRKEILKRIEHVVLFLHNFAAYLSHISNGSPKKIYLYFDKYLKHNIDTQPLNNWSDVIDIGEDSGDENQEVLFFDAYQQKSINFIYYLSNPIMRIITNDLSRFGDRYLVSLSFVIDHLYKYHNRSFSWRNLEQIPEILKTSKAPELREAMTSIIEFMTQIHLSPIYIGFNEYKFRKSIAEEINYASKISDEASSLFNFTFDESTAIIEYNTAMLNYYTQQAKQLNNKDEYNDVLARIHYNIGDLYFWNENYYSASMEYRIAIGLLDKDTLEKKDKSLSITLIRCIMKLGMTYEYRKLYTSAYKIYCDLISKLIGWRSIDEKSLGLDVLETRVDDWRGKKLLLVDKDVRAEDNYWRDKHYRNQVYHRILENNKSFVEDDKSNSIGYKYQNDIQSIEYSVDFDGVISGFSDDLTKEKSQLIASLTLFEEIRFIYQAILAKLCVVEKMVMSGITQTNINVAESEFKALHRIVNVEEKFMISADFFRKLAEILYYKNSLTILSPNQDSLYASLYFSDFDILANMDDFCFYHYRVKNQQSNAFEIKRDIKFFFENLNGNKTKDKYPVFKYNNIKTLYELFETLSFSLVEYYSTLNGIFPQHLNIDKARENVAAYLEFNKKIYKDKKAGLKIDNIISCDCHRNKLKNKNLRPACYACKYYNRSLRILMENMIIGCQYDTLYASKSIELLKFSFKKHLRYTRSNHVAALAKTIEGLANVMFSCTSLDKYEDKNINKGISVEVVKCFSDLTKNKHEKDEEQIIAKFSDFKNLTKLDKALLYYWAAYRYYIIVSQYDNAIGCLSNILTLFNYYINVINYYRTNGDLWKDEAATVEIIIGKENDKSDSSLLSAIFRLIARFSEFQYEGSDLTEIHEFKWILSKDYFEHIILSKLSLYPNIRSAFLRVLEIKEQGMNYLVYKGYRNKKEYRYFITKTYSLISPCYRNEVTSYEEVLGYYVKVSYNYNILNDILGRNLLLKEDDKQYNKDYANVVYQALAQYLSTSLSAENSKLDRLIFKVEDNAVSKLQLLEFIIHDSIICLINMIKVFTSHNHLTSYSRSFIGVIYNYLWEWSRYYEIMYDMYSYKTALMQGDNATAEEILEHIESKGDDSPDKEKIRQNISRCCQCIPDNWAKDERYGDLCARMYSKLRHDLDDVAINLVFSNYSAEMAINYYYMAEEVSSEGDAYKDMIGMLYFLNDDFNNDTCQVNIACERFLMNCDIVDTQRDKLHELYWKSNIYDVDNSYIEAPETIMDNYEKNYKRWFGRDLYINTEY